MSPAGSGPDAAPLMETRGIVKVFGTLRANDDIDLTLMPHEIHALLGENGAGKSTLVKILYGLLQPNEGEILWQGAPIRLDGPASARAAGIGMVFQHFSLFDNLTVAENVALALPPGRGLQGVAADIAAISKAYGLPLDPGRAVHTLSVGERQRIEIVRCLMQDPKLIILDEPTSVLTPQEADQLFVTLERIAGEGRAVLYISHRLEEVKRLCHTATVLRHGKKVATCDPRRETAASLARMMVGVRHRLRPPSRGDERAGRSGSCSTASPWHPPTSTASLCATCRWPFAAGRSWRSPASPATGSRSCSMRSRASGPPAGPAPSFSTASRRRALGITARRKLGAAFVPEERLGHAAAPRLPLSQNTLLTRHADVRPRPPRPAPPAAGRRARRRHLRRLRRAQGQARPGGGLAIRRQPAEIRDRARDAARARHPGGQPADLGRRCRRFRDDPPGADRPVAARRGSAGDQPGPRRDLRDRRPHRRHP